MRVHSDGIAQIESIMRDVVCDSFDQALVEVNIDIVPFRESRILHAELSEGLVAAALFTRLDQYRSRPWHKPIRALT